MTFSPAITYTVPAGWTNGEDLPGNFLLQLDGDSRYIGIYRDANAPYKCEEHPDPDVSQTVSDYTRWLRRHPLLHVTQAAPRLRSEGSTGWWWTSPRPPARKARAARIEGFVGNVPFIIGGRGPASLHHVITDQPGFKERLYLLRYRGGNVAIEIGPEGASLPEYLRLVAPIVRSLRFG